MVRLPSYLDGLGVLPVREVELGPVAELLERYRSYLLSERGLEPGTARYGPLLSGRRGPFVASRLRGDELDLSALRAADISEYVVNHCPGRPRGTARLIVTTLRSVGAPYARIPT